MTKEKQTKKLTEEQVIEEKMKILLKVQNHIDEKLSGVFTPLEIIGFLEVTKHNQTFIYDQVDELEKRLNKLEKKKEGKNNETKK